MIKKNPKPALPFPSDIIKVGRERELTSKQVLFLHTIRSGMNSKNKKNWRSQRRLAGEMRCSRTLVNQTAQQLEEKGLIKVNRTEGKNCCYELTISQSCSESKQGCKESEQVPVNILNRGCKKSEQGGVQNLNINTVSNNRSKEYSNDNNSSSIRGEEDCLKNSSSKSQAEKISEKDDGNLPANHSVLENFAPPELPEGIQNYYKSVDKVDLSFPRHGKRYDLQKYILPFTGKKADLSKKFGNDYSESKPDWWEKQFNDFYKTVIRYHWDTGSKPNHGFKFSFRRACISGIMAGFGFNPKTPEQLEKEKLEAKRLELENLKEAEKREKREATKRRKREERIRRLDNLYADLKKENSFTSNCLYNMGLISERGKLHHQEFEQFILDCRKAGKINGKNSLLKDLTHAILERV